MDSKGMKTVLVLGATGGVGGAIAEAMATHGWRVRAMARDIDRAAARWRAHDCAVDWRQGDAMVRADVVRAAQGVDAIVHAVNPLGYRNWDRLVLPMMENSIAASKASLGARVILPGTVYNFDPARTPLIGETSPQAPLSRKGAIRKAMEARLAAAASEGVPSLIVRAGDFFGPCVGQSWFGQAMVKPGQPVRRILHPGRRGIGHSWAYLPDLGETVARLMDVESTLRKAELVQFEGLWDNDGMAMTNAIGRAAGRPDIPVRAFPWWLMRLLSPFPGLPRELAEVYPYWRAPVRLDNCRLIELLGTEPRTPLDVAVARSLNGLGCIDTASAA